MKRTSILILLMGLLYLPFQAQTKRIAYKSHSGNMEAFDLALTHDDALDNSNFGEAPQPLVKYAKLDTVIYVSDTVSVMVTSNYCEQGSRTKLWKAGRDTVYNHPLFTQQDKLPYIKKKLKNKYNFKNPIDSVVFIGYDNPQEQQQQQPNDNQGQSIEPQAPQKKTATMGLATWILIIGGVALIVGAISILGRE